MTDDANNDAESVAVDGGEILRAIGLVYNNMALYSPEHSVTKQSAEDAFKILSAELEKVDEISFTVDEGLLMIDDSLVELKNPLMRGFVDQLYSLEIGTFAIEKDMTSEDFLKLIELLGAKPEEMKALGGFRAALETVGIKTVQATTVRYEKVTEGDIVVSKDKLAEAAGLGEEQTESIVAFLKGDVAADDEAVAGAMKEASKDADKLGDLIMKAADVSQGTADIDGGETMAHLVAGCLRRTQDALMSDPSMKTQKGKKSLEKTLLLLEKDLIEKMRNSDGDVSEDDLAEISDSVGEMVDELRIDSLAGDYMKKRTAITSNEDKILRFIRTKGLDNVIDGDLGDKLTEGGLSLEGWQELLVKSGAARDGVGGGKEGDGSGASAIGHLTTLLAKMEESVESEVHDHTQQTAEELKSVLGQVDKEVQKLVVKTQQKILDIAKDIEEEEKAEAEGKPQKKRGGMTKKRLLEVLAEVIQELCQPLSVINCTVQMMVSRGLGEITDQQSDMLKLADESGQRLQMVIDKLVEITGLPATMNPDASIQESIFGKE
jgi:hypothetical protein